MMVLKQDSFLVHAMLYLLTFRLELHEHVTRDVCKKRNSILGM